MGKIAAFGEKTRKIVSAFKFNYMKEDDSALGRVDFGVLTVAMMVAALDGVIRPEELAAFAKLAKKCRVSDGERAAYYESALHSAGYILLMSRSGLSEKALVASFVREAAKVLPTGFAGGSPEDIRRALVIWVTMGASDGDFCGIERKCVDAVRAQAAEIMSRRRNCREDLLRILNPAFRSVYDTYMDHFNRNFGQDEILRSLFNSPDRVVAFVASQLSVERYQLTVKNFSDSLTSTSSWLVKYVPKTILVYMDKRIECRLLELQDAISGANEEMLNNILSEIVNLQAAQKTVKTELKKYV